ncbi:uncharacterized protein LOC110849971 isoform X1 [Folsomia candida]|uniref:uncharacterized protein LOC110849971 isoform X1 n=1 Tax=Folsomia candida TaxID=158441 RepID=UPI000B90898C|nr:uncharacterized protein LOC110849971 isoform X1 [Folsomia candida]
MKLFSVFVVSLNLVNFVISDSVIKLYDKDGKELFTSQGSGGEVSPRREDFPIVLSCTSSSPNGWKINLSGDENQLKNGDIKRSTISDDTNGILFTSRLTLPNYTNSIVGRYACSSNHNSDRIGIQLFLQPDNPDVSLYLRPGSSHVVQPIVGDDAIVLPCPVSSISSDLFVEKMRMFTSSRVDIPYDASRNGFVIRPATGRYTDLIKYVGSFTCSQIGFGSEDAIAVEISSPIGYEVHPASEQMIVEGLETMTVSCGANFPFKLSLYNGREKALNVTYFYNGIGDRFRFRGLASYIPEKDEEDEISCATEGNGRSVHAWKFVAKDYQVKQRISSDRKRIECMISPKSKDDVKPSLKLSYCRNHDECLLFNQTEIHNDAGNFIISSCGEGCISATFNKVGGFWATCSDGGDIVKKALFYSDINLNLYSIEEPVEESGMAEINGKSESSVSVRWSRFFLPENGEWAMPKDFAWDETNREEQDGSLSSTITIQPNGQAGYNVSWSAFGWNLNKFSKNDKGLIQLSHEFVPKQAEKQVPEDNVVHCPPPERLPISCPETYDKLPIWFTVLGPDSVWIYPIALTFFAAGFIVLLVSKLFENKSFPEDAHLRNGVEKVYQERTGSDTDFTPQETDLIDTSYHNGTTDDNSSTSTPTFSRQSTFQQNPRSSQNIVSPSQSQMSQDVQMFHHEVSDQSNTNFTRQHLPSTDLESEKLPPPTANASNGDKFASSRFTSKRKSPPHPKEGVRKKQVAAVARGRRKRSQCKKEDHHGEEEGVTESKKFKRADES